MSAFRHASDRREREQRELKSSQGNAVNGADAFEKHMEWQVIFVLDWRSRPSQSGWVPYDDQVWDGGCPPYPKLDSSPYSLHTLGSCLCAPLSSTVGR